jgi:hypothetical protein
LQNDLIQIAMLYLQGMQSRAQDFRFFEIGHVRMVCGRGEDDNCQYDSVWAICT